MNKVPDAPPKEDLRMRVKKPVSRSQFGPNTALSPVASSSTPSSSGISSKAQGKKRKRKGNWLPLQRLFTTTPPTILNYPDSEACVTWSGTFLRVLDDTGSELYRIDRQKYKQITCTFWKPELPRMLVRFESPEVTSQEQPSDVIIWFDRDHFEQPEYQELFDWLSPHTRTNWSAVSSLWDDAQAQVKSMSTSARVFESNRQASVTVSDVDSVSIPDRPQQSKPRSSTHDFFSRSAIKRPLLGPSKDSVSTKQAGQGSTSKAVPNTAIPHSAGKAELATPLRRSTRQSSNSASATQPPVDADEVILVYPPDVPGKVNITRGDVARLQPGEFLNDTLIEFGLKLWLKNLEEKNPELAKQVHVFSSFFYKKLNKRDLAEGYSSVRKWTAKFNLFEKKYIIVPINERMHWYLAIIYEPEHVLTSPDPAIPIPPSPSISTNQEDATESKAASEVHDQGSPLTVDDEDPEDIKEMTSSECGIEQDLTNLTQACSISGDADSAAEKPHGEGEVDVMNVDEPATTKCKSSAVDEPIVIDGDASAAAPTSPMRYSPELPEIITHSSNQSTTASKTPSTNGEDADDLNLVSEDVPVIVEDSLVLDNGIDPSDFYGTGTRSGKQYGKPKPRPVAKPRRSKAQPTPSTQVPNRTYVLTLDSLGTGHKHAARVLATYLRHEAKDKKGIESEVLIDSMQVHVPTQPNFCDCGVYLLHLAQTFISDTTFYMDQVFLTTAKTPNSARQTLWKDEEVPLMREGLKKRILALSKDWKQAQPDKPSSSKAKDLNPIVVGEPSSDSDIDIIEHTVAPSAKGRGKNNANKRGAAARIR
ncbi:hypothetical protein EST38_g1338 [Candolleomyces aberdarensis]|uniref:Ubiquitin-like protease family profile domain-containing protein n=1 Tax=Candolleomyces aberdarensis TaxID=2316362 RepID=A0A4Q2DX92_9AGAR|nr:hypothetical protein EST38_g1338 [Candolleomyces aberdarensis]